MKKQTKTLNKKKWQSIGSVLIVGLFVCASLAMNSADLSLKDIAFGYGGGSSSSVTVSASLSTVEASPTSVEADGTSASTITVTVKSISGSVMSGKTVSVSSDRGTTTDTISTITGTTSSNGKATFSVKSSTAGEAVISATTGGTAITDTATVTFTTVEGTITPAATTLSEGAVARIGSGSEVYVIKIVGDKKFKRHIVSPEVFNSYGHLSWSGIQSTSSLDDYSLSAWVRVCTGANGAPAATDKVYEVNADSTMHWLNMTAAQFYARGGSDEAIYNVNDGELGLYTLGVDVLYQ
jgi:hypothetical protein